MKKFTLLSLVLLLSWFESSAQKATIVGGWSVDIDKTVAVMDINTKQQYDTLPVQVKARATDAMKGREFYFNKNGEVTVNWKTRTGQQTSSGTWKISDGKLDITIDDRTVVYNVEFKSATEIIWMGQSGKGFFNNLYLTKQ